MQNDAMKRVMEMQRWAKESYSVTQGPAGQNFSSQTPAGQEAFVHQTDPAAQGPIPCPELVRQLFLLLGTGDPVLSAALAYLL